MFDSYIYKGLADRALDTENESNVSNRQTSGEIVPMEFVEMD